MDESGDTGLRAALRALPQRARQLVHELSEPPAAVSEALGQIQVERLHRQTPLLHVVGIVNTLIVMWVAAADGLGLATLVLPGLVVLLSAVRLTTLWFGSTPRAIPSDLVRYRRTVSRAAIASVTMAALWCLHVYTEAGFAHRAMVPISLALGCFCIAYCLTSLPATAIAVLGIGVLPSIAAAFVVGDPIQAAVFAAIASAAVLQMRLVVTHYAHLIAALRAEQRLREAAHTDDLTGLPNRRAFAAALEDALSGDTPCALALIDLDGFKAVNDRHGHPVGDRYLKAVAWRLSGGCRASDLVARLGGDEFVVLLRGSSGDGDLAMRAGRLLDALCRPCEIDALTLPMSASIGVARVPADGATLSAALNAADHALYAAKRAGKGRVAFCQDGDGAVVVRTGKPELRVA